MKHIIYKIMAAAILLTLAALYADAAPASEAEYRKLSKAWTLNPDGSQEYRFSMELTLFTHSAMNSTYGESFIVYDPEYQTLNINSSYTVRKDGTIVETPPNAFVEVLPAAAAGAPAYNRLKEMVVVHTGLELGATIVLDYTVTSKAGYLPGLDISGPVEQSSPVREYTLSVSVPEGTALDYSLSGLRTKPSEDSSAGLRTLTWKLRNVKAASRLPDTYHFDSPYFEANTLASSGAAAGIVSRQLDDGESNPVLKSLAAEITRDASDDTGKLKAIYAHIRNGYAHIPLGLGTCGYRIRPAEEVAGSAYGTDAELVNVLQGLLEAAGLEADVCAAYARPDTAGAGLAGLSLYVRTEADGREFMLGPSTQATRRIALLRQYCPALDLSAGEVEPPAYQDAAISGIYDMTLEGDRVSVRSEVSVSDFFLDPEGTAAGMITSGDSDAAVTRSGKSSSFAWSSGHAAERAGEYLIVHLPDCPFGAAHDTWLYGGSARDITLTLPAAYDESYTYRIVLGDKTLCTPETALEIDNGAGSLEISVKEEDGCAVVTRTLKLSGPQISPDVYPDYLELMRAWSDHNHTSVLLK